MKVFVSSLISGYESYRSAVADAAATLGHQVVRAEDFPPSAGTPQQACLAAVRASDLVILLIGERYGFTQPSGLSATHEEYREAKERRPVLVFVQSGVDREPSQREFLAEVEAWSTGHFRGDYASPQELQVAALRAMHEYELATMAGPAEEGEMLARATALLTEIRRPPQRTPQLVLAVAGGPYQQVLRPAEIEHKDLFRDVQREALFGDHQVLDSGKGTNVAIRNGALALDQDVASILLNEAGSIRITQPLLRDTTHRPAQLPALVEEDVSAALINAVRFSGWLLDRVDHLHRITDVVPVAQIRGSSYMPWRTRAEHAASPNAMPMRGSDNDVTAQLTPARRHRQALIHGANRLAEDLVVLLRREVGR